MKGKVTIEDDKITVIFSKEQLAEILIEYLLYGDMEKAVQNNCSEEINYVKKQMDIQGIKHIAYGFE